MRTGGPTTTTTTILVTLPLKPFSTGPQNLFILRPPYFLGLVHVSVLVRLSLSVVYEKVFFILKKFPTF